MMEKFVRKNGKDPFINTPNDTTPALFGHINAIVTEVNASGTTTGLRSKTVVHDFSQTPLLKDQSLVINDDYFISANSIITAFYYYAFSPLTGDSGAELSIGISTVGLDDILSSTAIGSVTASISLSGFTPLATNNADRGVLITATEGDITGGKLSVMIVYWPFNIS
jgi:hypothetical protein